MSCNITKYITNETEFYVDLTPLHTKFTGQWNMVCKSSIGTRKLLFIFMHIIQRLRIINEDIFTELPSVELTLIKMSKCEM